MANSSEEPEEPEEPEKPEEPRHALQRIVSCCALAQVGAEPNRSGEVLVVEDDPAIRRLVTAVLRREGFGVDTAADGLEAVLKLGLAEYDVIVLDLMMPGLDGFTFLETFAEHEPARLKKVIVTSAASPAVIESRMRVPPYGVVPKPFNLDDLVQKVRACVAAQSDRAT